MFILNVEGAVYRNEKWLVIKRSSKEEHAGGLLSLVGGTVENEGFSKNLLERTLKRELFEEVGINIKENVNMCVIHLFCLKMERKSLSFVFYCEIDTGEPFVKSPDEVEAVFWLTADEILANPNAPIWLKESIEEAHFLQNKIQKK